MLPGLALAACLLAFASTAHALFGFGGKFKAVQASGGVVSIPLSEVSDGKAHYYVFKRDGFAVKFFLLQSPDGMIRAAFDACDECFREKKGYVQDGEFMVCVNCSQRFHASRINEVRGGCNPSPLERTIGPDSVTIRERDIMAGRGYF
ncbi:DUF2318 domain-containing protein [Pseudodesulfovibrio sp. F-1]|uniref:DUF2318 domain-containing protein n=2 Tax=Pseudodesulfovibrio alkaliphilus TaxID=2661613 RepID=A0A7K1KMG0_9BACT|nr:DUF2318 domain-containing protein [Pseudodesulfovibrio alkaliphilus]